LEEASVNGWPETWLRYRLAIYIYIYIIALELI
jgi:hypothetical protein